MAEHRSPDGTVVTVPDSVSIGPYVSIGSGAQIGPGARIRGPEDVLTVMGRVAVTCYRVEDAEGVEGWEVAAGCWRGTVDEMRANLRKDPAVHWPDDPPEVAARWSAEHKATRKMLAHWVALRTRCARRASRRE